MEQTEKLDLFPILQNLWSAVKRLWLLGLLLAALCAAALAFWERQNYRPVYEASTSFMIKVANPLYASAAGYNAQTAEQMEKTFPYILSSNALQEKVKQ